MPRDPERYVVHGISRGPKRELRVALSQHKGRRIAELRLFVRTKRGGWMPTHEGCSLEIEQIGELELAAQKLRQALERVPAPA